ncbi:sensor histidine kinase [Falsibacillus albus]|uniref:histidine kinase n=1 Tax=Falsibacillus albus TaxID=2478915 RepID=A0A3L7JUQ6_9BACI|nr:HAMP domain-containing sensor histidine kinase [Falsibacillus albus]RLQ93839.1 sensor histidine kinase [Falsibacillus albus]
MKIKWIFLIANGVSVLMMFTFLTISYVYMVLPNNIIFWLSVITICSSVLSSVIHYMFTKPVERSIHLLAKESQEIAKGNFDRKLPVEGPFEIKELTNRFNQMSERLNEAFFQIKQSEMSRKELVANISHDLRTPMSSIKAFVSAIQDGVVEDEETFKQYLKTIVLETERLDQLIQQLFQLSLLDSGAIKLQKEEINIDEFLLSVFEHEQIHLQKKKIELNIDLPNQIPKIDVDKSYFEKVLFNLLDNAIRFSPVNGVIDIKVQPVKDKELLISIRDHGEGISEEELPHIFERMYRVEKSRNQQFGGAGLGLAIAKTIVERHGGTIMAESKVKKGSIFSIIIPIKNREEGESGEL